MGTFVTSDGDLGPKFTGNVLVGPSWEVRKEFYKPTFDKANGRVTSVVAGKIHAALPQPVYSYDRTKEFVAPEECVGHQVSFFLNHLKLNHAVGEGYDDYKFLDTRWDRFGRPWPNYTLEMLLSKVGASTKDLNTEDDDKFLKEIVALLTTGDPFPVAMWESKQGDIEYQIPMGTEVLAQFYRFLYYDWDRKRPTWVAYEATGKNEKGEERTYIFRDVSFLLRVVAPDPWTGTVLRMPVNYTVKHSEKDGNPTWWHHEKAIFSSVMNTLGIKVKDFAKNVDDALLTEVEVGEPANWLAPLEVALQEMATRRLLYITIPEKPLKYRDISTADEMVIERVTGQSSFTPSPLRSVRDLSKEELEGPTEDEGTPGFDDFGLTPLTVMTEINSYAGMKVWNQPNTAPTKEGRVFAKTYLVAAFSILNIPCGNPLAGGSWTKAKMEQLKSLLENETWRAACESASGEDKGVAIELGHNLLSPANEPEELDDGGPGF